MAKDVIKLRVLKGRDYRGLSGWAPNIIPSVPMKEEGESHWTDTEEEAI